MEREGLQAVIAMSQPSCRHDLPVWECKPIHFVALTQGPDAFAEVLQCLLSWYALCRSQDRQGVALGLELLAEAASSLGKLLPCQPATAIFRAMWAKIPPFLHPIA